MIEFVKSMPGREVGDSIEEFADSGKDVARLWVEGRDNRSVYMSARNYALAKRPEVRVTTRCGNVYLMR